MLPLTSLGKFLQLLLKLLYMIPDKLFICPMINNNLNGFHNFHMNNNQIYECLRIICKLTLGRQINEHIVYLVIFDVEENKWSERFRMPSFQKFRIILGFI